MMRRIPRSFQFAIVSLLVLFLIAFVFNALASFYRSAGGFVIRPTDPKTNLLFKDPSEAIAWKDHWPDVPPSIESQYIPYNWIRVDQPMRQVYMMFFRESDVSHAQDYCVLNAIHTGWPFTAVKRKQVTDGASGTVIWPNDRAYVVIYYPLGLILNPFVYALPVWLVLMGARWAYITRRARKRTRLGLCPGCMYDLDGLSICPECGTAVSRASAS